MYAIFVFIVMIGLMLLNVPIGPQHGLCCFYGHFHTETMPMMSLVQRLYNGMDSFILIAVPLFMLAGQLISCGGVTRDLLKVAQAMVGRFRGGLAYVNVVTSMFFAGITGAASSDSASVGGILIPAMQEDGYDDDFTVGVTAASSTLGVLIPPSNPLVMYAAATSVSVGALLMGGAIPGILLGLGQCLVVGIISKKRNYPKRKPMSFKETIIALIQGNTGSFYHCHYVGRLRFRLVYTHRGQLGVAVLYSFLLGVFYYRELKLSAIPNIIRDVSITMGTVTAVGGGSSGVGLSLCHQ